jgi:heme/copper-type cytochrome/quinol oxidase subunit 1
MKYNRNEEGKFANKGKFNIGKFIFYTFLLIIIVGGAVEYVKSNKNKEVASPVVQKTTDNELERIMNEESFRKVTILRARKVASDSKMSQENIKHEEIVKAEKTRHEAILAQIEAENEAIRAEELALVGTPSLKSPQRP